MKTLTTWSQITLVWYHFIPKQWFEADNMLKGKLYEQKLFYYSNCYSLPNNRICSFQFSSVLYCILLQRVYFVIAFHKAVLYHNIFTNMNKRNHLAGNRNTLSDSKINTGNKKPHSNYSFDSIVHTVKHCNIGFL